MRRFDDACVAVYKEQLDEDGQVDFKGKAKTFVRAYGFLASILPYTHAEWEKLSIFLNFLVPKLPAPVDEDLSQGILESIDMDSYRVEKKAAMQVNLTDEDAEIEHDEALRRVMTSVLNDDMQLFKQFSDNESFRRWLTDRIFSLTYEAT